MKNAWVFLFLSFLSGVLETGAFTLGMASFGISMGLALALAYQGGNLARNPLRLSLRGSAVALVGALLLFPFAGGGPFPMILTVALLSGGVQSARGRLIPEHGAPPVSIKRTVRVAGFVFGIIGGALIGNSGLVFVSVAACLVVLPKAITQSRNIRWTHLNRRFASDGYGWIMLIHQTHYFAYAYILLALLLETAGISSSKTTFLQALGVAGCFAMGWFSYILGEWLLKTILKMPPRRAAIAGHAWVAVCLACMGFLTGHPHWLGLAWMLGGFGGGSVYAIKELARKDACRADIELWEDWGHVLGVSLSLAAVLLCPGGLAAPFFLALAAALGTIVLLVRKTGMRDVI